jgi:hypothetical protein
MTLQSCVLVMYEKNSVTWLLLSEIDHLTETAAAMFAILCHSLHMVHIKLCATIC